MRGYLFNMLFKCYFNKAKIIVYTILFLFILALSACNSLPLPLPDNDPDQSGYGDIFIDSEPANASIYLDGIYTGFNTPKKLTNITSGSHLVTIKLTGYLNSNNILQVMADEVNTLQVSLSPLYYFPPPSIGYLTDIDIKPDSINLTAGKTVNIASITAYYSDGETSNISFGECSIFSINKDVATVSSNGLISAISEGQTSIWATYTENNKTKSDYINVTVSGQLPNPGNLSSIEVLPETMGLDIGESKTISSILAYYDNGTDNLINPNMCNFGTDNNYISVDSNGIVTGLSSGTSVITVSYTENSTTRDDYITVYVSENLVIEPVYRALLVGVGDYIYFGEEGDLQAPPHDVNKMIEMLEDCQFGNSQIRFDKVNAMIDQQATKQNILNKIQNTFSGASSNDISYFYYSGHGATLNQISYLCPADFNEQINTAISVDELESALSAVPGTKVVLIDSCHSGGFIGKSFARDNELEKEESNLVNFNNSIIDTFANKQSSKNLLTSAEYQVLTSSHWYEQSYEIYPDSGQPFGVFTQGLYEGCSVSNNYPADINQNDRLSLNEAYNFIAQWVRSMGVNQNVQAYPMNSSFIIIEY